jgi:hypothetical protein
MTSTLHIQCALITWPPGLGPDRFSVRIQVLTSDLRGQGEMQNWYGLDIRHACVSPLDPANNTAFN